MNINLIFEIILILFVIIVINGIIYSLTFLNLNNQNSSENITMITNSSEKDGLAITSLIASNSLSLTSSDSSESQTLSITSSDSSDSETLSETLLETIESETLSETSSETIESQTLSETSSETNASQDIIDRINTEDLLSINERSLPYRIDDLGNYTSFESSTILNSQTYEEWRIIASELQNVDLNTPDGLIQQIKLTELNILYSQDIIRFGISQTELWLLIQEFPIMRLFDPDINHTILVMMSYMHI